MHSEAQNRNSAWGRKGRAGCLVTRPRPSPSLEKVRWAIRGWQEAGEEAGRGDKGSTHCRGLALEGGQASAQDSPTKSRSLVASMLLRVMAPKFSSGQFGKGKATGLGWRARRGLLSPPTPQPGCPAPSPHDPLSGRRSREGQEVGKVFGTGPRREAGALSLPGTTHPYRGLPLPLQPHCPSIIDQSFTRTPALSRCVSARPGRCGGWSPGKGGAGCLTCSEQLPVHTQRVACDGPAAEMGGDLSDQGSRQAGPGTYLHAHPCRALVARAAAWSAWVPDSCPHAGETARREQLAGSLESPGLAVTHSSSPP